MKNKKLQNLKQKSLSEITDKDWDFLKKEKIINGCGSHNRGFLQKFFLKILSPKFFTASCNKHDFGYWKGGDETRRKECDEKFLQAILQDVENISENFLKKFFYKIIAYLFYTAVRIGGRKYFNYY